MQTLEKEAAKEGLLPDILMENAALALSHYITSSLSRESSFVFILGKGNNAGDGLHLAYHLIESGFCVYLYSLFSEGELSPLAQKGWERLAEKKIFPQVISSAEELNFSPDAYLIDALLGIGFSGKITGLMKECIEKINASKNPVIAIDIPSGLDATRGSINPVAIKAGLTLTLGLPKKGFFQNWGWEHVGELQVLDIGIPSSLTKKVESHYLLLNPKRLADLLPKRKRCAHKYEAGYVVVVAGSSEMAGAGMLASAAVLRTGAGITTLFHPKEAASSFANAYWEVIRKGYTSDDLEAVFEELKRAGSLLIGPGLGRTKEAKKTYEEILRKTSIPLVIDGDGLFFLSQGVSLPPIKDTILTPHKKEMLRLLQKESSYDEDAFHVDCQKYVDKNQVVLLLKGAPSFIFSPNQKPIINTLGDRGMATAGSGDVLAGMIASLLAQKKEALAATILGSSLHGLSGQICHIEIGPSYIASDILEHIPEAIKEVQQEE